MICGRTARCACPAEPRCAKPYALAVESGETRRRPGVIGLTVGWRCIAAYWSRSEESPLVRPSFLRCLFTVAAAISSARSSLRPLSISLFLMCLYRRSSLSLQDSGHLSCPHKRFGREVLSGGRIAPQLG